MNEDAPPGQAWAPTREGINRPRFDPSLYDPTFVPQPRSAAADPPDAPIAPGLLTPPTPAVPGEGADATATARNTLATASLVLGLSSILVPPFAVLGVILGVVSLRRVQRLPWLPGRERAVAGIITSLIFGTVSVVVLIVVATSGV